MDPMYELAGDLLEHVNPEWKEPPRIQAPTEARGVLQTAARRLSEIEQQCRREVMPPAIPSELCETVRTRLRQTLRAALDDNEQLTGHHPDHETSIRTRRRIIAEQLYASATLAIDATRVVGRYPSFIAELAFGAHAAMKSPPGKPSPGDEALRSPGSTLAARNDEPPLTPDQQYADRFTADPEFALAFANRLERPRTFSLVVRQELAEVERSRKLRLSKNEAHAAAKTGGAPWERAHDADLVGLAFSGGGIRSATFGLGALQALAELDLLRRVDLLSTVSGGGYIGSWLTGWISRLRGGVAEVQQRLAPRRAAMPEANEARPLAVLRQYSHYLTPRSGVISVDTWTMIVVWFRNTLLNQAILIALGLALMTLPHLVEQAMRPMSGEGLGWALGLFVLALATVCWSLASFDDEPQQADGGGDAAATDGEPPPGQLGPSALTVNLGAVVPMLLAGLLVAPLLPRVTSPDEARTLVDHPLLAWVAVAFFIGFLVIQVAGHYDRCVVPRRPRTKLAKAGAWVWAFLWMAACGAIAAALGALLVMLTPLVLVAVPPDLMHRFRLALLPPLLVLAATLAVIVHIGLLGRHFPDERREWWSRLGATQFRLSMAWAALWVLSLAVPYYVWSIEGWGEKSLAVATWVLGTLAGVRAGRARDDDGSGRSGSHFTRWAARLGPPIFVIGLLVMLSLLADAVLHRSGVDAVWVFLTALAAGLILSWRVDVNEFSMHHFYKNRLVRCYLGASRDREVRRPNNFTGFDPCDDVKLATLGERRPSHAPPYAGPYPIINTALNLTKGEDLAWQERKAEAFVFTPIVTGYELEVDRSPGGLNLRRAGYRPTAKFGYTDGGPGLGTAVAISGAAASPNMGYHSSAATAFLMTVFNVRLGWWVGNPRYTSAIPGVESPWRKPSPTIGILYLFKELFGRTDNRAQYVYLSDGGHFENLGLYELVRRRCRYIIAVDAEEDSQLAFGGLANAIRKCRTDFDVTIEIDTGSIRPVNGRSGAHCTLGRITYPERAGRPEERGYLLYLKSSVTGDEPSDVLEYAIRQQGTNTFPHQSTGDQWFDETQFESYRALGYHVATDAMGAAVQATRKGKPSPAMADLFEYLEELWTPLGVGQPADQRAHAEAYDALYARVHARPGSPPLDPVLFSTFGQPPSIERDALYIGHSMIELVHQVFADLQLDKFKSRPHNAGWMRIFHEWTKRPEVRSAWGHVRHTYSRRFQIFFEELERQSEKPLTV